MSIDSRRRVGQKKTPPSNINTTPNIRTQNLVLNKLQGFDMLISVMGFAM